MCGSGRQWEVKHNDELGQLAALVGRIVDLSSSTTASNGKFEICLTLAARLDVQGRLPDAGDVLPEGLRARWDAASNEVTCEPLDGRDEAGGSLYEWDETGEDFTACSESCAYCGGCTHDVNA